MYIEESKLELLEAKPTPTPPQKARKRSTWREKIAIQAIICACLLALFLGFNVINTPFTNNATQWVEDNLSFDFLTDEDGIGSWANRVVNIFRSDETAGTIHVETMQNPSESWIDPYILREINETEAGN